MVREAGKRVLELLREEPPVKARQWSKEEWSVAVWLRGNDAAVKSLKSLFRARHDYRASLPVPSNSHDLAVSAGAQKELVDLMKWLDELYAAPVVNPADQEDENV